MQKLSAIYVMIAIGYNCIAMECEENKTSAPLHALFTAIVDYQYNVSADLVQQQPELVDTYGQYDGYFTTLTPVHLASFVGNSVALKQLLGISRKSINAPIEAGYTPLHLARCERVVQTLIDGGADIDQKNGGDSLLHTKLFHNGLESLEATACLIKRGANINQANKSGKTLLHEACYKNVSPFLAQLLLENGADPDVMSSIGSAKETAFDMVIKYSRKKDLFAKVGFINYCFQSGHDPFDYLINDSENFFTSYVKKDHYSSFDNFLSLYTMANQEEMGRYAAIPMPQARRVEIRTDGQFKTYIFRRATFADLKECLGENAVACLKEYFGRRFHEAQQLIMEHDAEFSNYLNTCDINSIDQEGNSLLDKAIIAENTHAIELLMHRTDGALKKKAFTRIALSENEECIWKFCTPLIENFFLGRDKKMDSFVLKKILCWERIHYKDRVRYFFTTLIDRPDQVSLLFFKQGVGANCAHKKGFLPLTHVVEFLLQKPWSWKSFPSDYKHNICLLLQHGAVVEEHLLSNDYRNYKEKAPLRDLLQSAYEKQHLKNEKR